MAAFGWISTRKGTVQATQKYVTASGGTDCNRRGWVRWIINTMKISVRNEDNTR